MINYLSSIVLDGDEDKILSSISSFDLPLPLWQGSWCHFCVLWAVTDVSALDVAHKTITSRWTWCGYIFVLHFDLHTGVTAWLEIWPESTQIWPHQANLDKNVNILILNVLLGIFIIIIILILFFIFWCHFYPIWQHCLLYVTSHLDTGMSQWPLYLNPSLCGELGVSILRVSVERTLKS